MPAFLRPFRDVHDRLDRAGQRAERARGDAEAAAESWRRERGGIEREIHAGLAGLRRRYLGSEFIKTGPWRRQVRALLPGGSGQRLEPVRQLLKTYRRKLRELRRLPRSRLAKRARRDIRRAWWQLNRGSVFRALLIVLAAVVLLFWLLQVL